MAYETVGSVETGKVDERSARERDGASVRTESRAQCASLDPPTQTRGSMRVCSRAVAPAPQQPLLSPT
eukprot:5994078-Pleurochrysis_carterae.AAC.2